MCCLLIVNLIEVGSVWRRTKIERDARDAAKNAYLICLMVANAAISENYLAICGGSRNILNFCECQ